MSWNPRYIAYAKAHGKKPEEMLAHDKVAYPGGKMCGFICWIGCEIAKFRKASPSSFVGDNLSNEGQKIFDKFLCRIQK